MRVANFLYTDTESAGQGTLPSMELEGSLPYSRVTTTGFCPEFKYNVAEIMITQHRIKNLLVLVFS